MQVCMFIALCLRYSERSQLALDVSYKDLRRKVMRLLQNYTVLRQTAINVYKLYTLLVVTLAIVPMATTHGGHDHVEETISLTLGRMSETYTTHCNQFTYFKVQTLYPCQDLVVEVIHEDGEPNVYISKSPVYKPTLRSLTWSSYKWGSEKIRISSWEPDFEVGDFYIGVNAFCGDQVHTKQTPATYKVHAYQTDPEAHPIGVADLYNSHAEGTIPAEGYQFHRFCVPDQCVKVNVTISHCMDPKLTECAGTYGYPELLVSKSIQQPKVNDLAWKLADVVPRWIILQPDVEEFVPGHYYVGIYGWCTPAESCPDPDTCGICSAAEDLPYTITVTATVLDDDQCMRGNTEKPDSNGGTIQSQTFLGILITIVLAI
ncbi:hypothetical protein CAPTEDRAFT_224042 [Capitella teleta]|uniref:Uncharacterized protein n=1 Tax=Capitella teleta TaxID=283909 RepID=R7VA04_CAPTE|nr:hypothetical protein CAPTEDRAFT_224042 [Capitella teleta]|eukprot:ELU12565.1 hypothetical protein CAPTEDRAFT_224042 [Capitella teleta]